MTHPVRDLREALDLLEATGQLVQVTRPVDARLEIARTYAPFAGSPAPGPTGPGPAILFDRVQPSQRSVAVGVFGTRSRCLDLVGAATAKDLHHRLRAGAERPLAPVPAGRGAAARVPVPPRTDALPAPLVTTADAGAYVTMGIVRATDPDSGVANNSIHRICIQNEREMTIWIVPGRDLGALAQSRWDRGEALPIAIHVGLDPAIYVAACLTGKVAPLGCDELGVAGSLRGTAVELVPALSQPLDVISHAEWVIEGMLEARTLPENGRGGGASMPEFLGYGGSAHPGLPVVTITGISTRTDPIWQTVVGPGHEQSNLLSFGMEVDVLHRLADAGIEGVLDAHASTAGGGQLLLFLQCRPDGQRDIDALVAACRDLLGEMRMLKTIVLVDDDVDLASHTDLWWAVTTRTQASRDLTILPDCPGFPLDPSQSPDYDAGLAAGRTTKLLIDALVPPGMRSRFARPRLGV